MRKKPLLVISVPIAIAVGFELPSMSTGMYVPGITRSAPACGQCHSPTPGAAIGFPRISVLVQPSVRSLASGQSISIAIAASGGQTASTLGGFACDTTAGTFSAGVNTVLVPPNRAITHSNSSSRSWSFGYTAPTTPGVVSLYAVSNTVNGDMLNGPEDMWAFHGADDQDTNSTPAYLFVNANGVQNVGRSCAGAFGNVPVLGSAQVPSVGNASFALEMHGAPPLSPVGLMLGGALFPVPIDLTSIGVNGCELYFNPFVSIAGATGPGNPRYGEGVALIPLPIPNNQSLRGGVLYLHAYVLDLGSGRAIPITLTNALAVTLQ